MLRRAAQHRAHGASPAVGPARGDVEPGGRDPRPDLLALAQAHRRPQRRWQDDARRRSSSTTTRPRPRARPRSTVTPRQPWASPDIILVPNRRPAATEPDPGAARRASSSAARNWDADFSDRTAPRRDRALTTVDELITTMATANFGGGARSSSSPTSRSPTSSGSRTRPTEALDVTVADLPRPGRPGRDRRAWIEMDKFLVTLPAAARPSSTAPTPSRAVIKRPAETRPADDRRRPTAPRTRAPTATAAGPTRCCCRAARPTACRVRLLVMLTDAAIDRVAAPGHCGSMSFCGAVDRYPDTRDMGYPFCRPFAGRRRRDPRHARRRSRNAAAGTVTDPPRRDGSLRGELDVDPEDFVRRLRRLSRCCGGRCMLLELVDQQPRAGPRCRGRRAVLAGQRRDHRRSGGRRWLRARAVREPVPQRLGRGVEAAVVADLVEAGARRAARGSPRRRRARRTARSSSSRSGRRPGTASRLSPISNSRIRLVLLSTSSRMRTIASISSARIRRSGGSPSGLLGMRGESARRGRAAGRPPSRRRGAPARRRRRGARTRRRRSRAWWAIAADCSSVGGPSTSIADPGQQAARSAASSPKLA